MTKLWPVIPGFLLLLAACQSAALQPALSTGGEDNRQALEAAMSSMLGDVGIILADNAFMESSELSIEHRARNITNRAYGVPKHFRLWFKDETCILEHVASGRQKMVTGLSCRPAP